MKFSKKQKRELTEITVGAALYITAVVASALAELGVWSFLLLLPSYFVLGFPIMKKAVKNLAHGNMLDENFLMSIASVGAFILGECSEGVAVMLFDRVGEFFEDYAVRRSRGNIAELMSLCPEYANIIRDGELVTVDPAEVSVGDTVVVLPGERVPLDGVILSGASSFDTAALTGESVPTDVSAGDKAVSGFINLSGKLEIRVEKAYEDSTVAKVLALIEDATEKKSRSENFITRFARVYTPIVVGCAASLAVIPSVLNLMLPSVITAGAEVWVYRALLFLVVSCPCALVISVPMSFFGGIGGASKKGVLIKGSNYIEMLSKADTFVFDKTGTLTHGTFTVTEVEAAGISDRELIRLAASAESCSTHPIARALCAHADEVSVPHEVTELAGRGVRAVIDGKTVLVGNGKLMDESSVSYIPARDGKTTVYVAADGVYVGSISLGDKVKDEAKSAVSALNRTGKTVMLTGDVQAVAEAVAKDVGIKEYHCGLLPHEKVEHLEKLQERGTCVFCGDGINDAPSLALADVGVAMGGVGSDAAIEAADVVIMDDNPEKLVVARRVARKTMGIVRQNIAFSLVIKIGFMILGALGLASMWGAVFADVGVLILAVANSMRAGRVK